MLYRFPKSFYDYPDPGVRLVTSGKSILAYYRIEEEIKKVEGFLTENTLIFVLKGSKNIHFPDKQVEASAGDLLLLKRGAYFMSTFLASEHGYEAIMLCMDDNFLKTFIREYTSLDAVKPSYTHLPLQITCAPEIKAIRDGILWYMNHQNPNTPELIRLKLEELLLVLLSGEYKTPVWNFLLHLFDTSASTMDLTIKANLFKPFSLTDYARLCGFSLSSFKREFAKLYQTSPKDWINKERLQHAHFLLQSSDKNVNEIAYDCGFDNASYFIKLYKAKYGHTPKNAHRSKIANF